MVMHDIVTDLSTPTASAETVERAREGWDAWRASRLTSVTGPTGNLALIETRWLAAGDETTAEQALADQPESVTATELTRTSLETGEPERGVRLWDAQSPAIRDFEAIDVFPF